MSRGKAVTPNGNCINEVNCEQLSSTSNLEGKSGNTAFSLNVSNTVGMAQPSVTTGLAGSARPENGFEFLDNLTQLPHLKTAVFN